MKKVYICAPLAGDVPGNIERVKEYAAYALKECGVAPVIPHFFALILDDGVPSERELGLRAGQSLLWLCDEVWCFGDSITTGMEREIQLARQLNVPVRYFRAKNILIGGNKFYEKKTR